MLDRSDDITVQELQRAKELRSQGSFPSLPCYRRAHGEIEAPPVTSVELKLATLDEGQRDGLRGSASFTMCSLSSADVALAAASAGLYTSGTLIEFDLGGLPKDSILAVVAHEAASKCGEGQFGAPLGLSSLPPLFNQSRTWHQLGCGAVLNASDATGGEARGLDQLSSATDDAFGAASGGVAEDDSASSTQQDEDAERSRVHHNGAIVACVYADHQGNFKGSIHDSHLAFQLCFAGGDCALVLHDASRSVDVLNWSDLSLTGEAGSCLTSLDAIRWGDATAIGVFQRQYQ